MLDFDDLLYIAVKDGLPLPKYGFVFVDEAQDTNAIQRAILRKIMGPRSRLIAVGDPAQAIYGFRGADSNSLRILADEFKCITLPLTVSYRCPESVISYARQWVSHIESAPGAEKGFVEELGTNWKPAILQANDLVVCRTTMPLIGLALKLMLARIPVTIMGRDIGQGLTRLIEKQKASNLDDLGDKLNVWRIRETEKALARMEEEKVEAIEDKVSAIHCLIDGLNEDERTIAALLQLVEKMFSQGRNVVILATIHKSKGLEANRVFWLNRSKCPSKWAKQDWQKDQERNLCYVAATRAKKSLHIIEEH
jgi:superfamily I DNA/RNA helicase